MSESSPSMASTGSPSKFRSSFLIVEIHFRMASSAALLNAPFP